MNRRGFLSVFLPGITGAVVGTVSTNVLADSTKSNKSNPECDGPVCENTIQIQSGTKLKPKQTHSEYTLLPPGFEYEEYKQINISVGQDGNLWLKTENGEWKRVVTE